MAMVINAFDFHMELSKHKPVNIICPSCSHQFHCQGESVGIRELPAGMKFDPSDQEILDHLEGKVRGDSNKLHPLIDQFIPTLDGENGICSTHPEKLPGVSCDGISRHFFHCPSNAYTTGTRKRRKVGSDAQTRWHKTGKTRPILVDGEVKGYKKILVLYTNYGSQKKPSKTNWVMHQYHLGLNEDEKDGEMVLSKVFYQMQPRQCVSADPKKSNCQDEEHSSLTLMDNGYRSTYASIISYDQQGGHNKAGFSQPLINANNFI